MDRHCIHIEHPGDVDYYDTIMNKCHYTVKFFTGIQCRCDEEHYCNGAEIDAWAEEFAANITTDAPDSTDLESPETTDAHIAPGSSDDSSKSADPEMIVLLIGVIITFML